MCKLFHYFDAHEMLMVTDYPVNDILHNHDTTRHIAKWVAELWAFHMNLHAMEVHGVTSID